jgi:lipoprotein signal peptidase
VLNLADACVTIGVGILLVRTLVGGDRHRPSRQTDRV